jgi:cyclopropane-fatty-acyl-phospholipid synthase
MWEFYLSACEAAFRRSGLVVFQIQLSKRIGAVPLTRDYIGEWERSHAATAPDEITEFNGKARWSV